MDGLAWRQARCDSLLLFVSLSLSLLSVPAYPLRAVRNEMKRALARETNAVYVVAVLVR
jgi:hypothetical protein